MPVYKKLVNQSFMCFYFILCTHRLRRGDARQARPSQVSAICSSSHEHYHRSETIWFCHLHLHLGEWIVKWTDPWSQVEKSLHHGNWQHLTRMQANSNGGIASRQLSDLMYSPMHCSNFHNKNKLIWNEIRSSFDVVPSLASTRPRGYPKKVYVGTTDLIFPFALAFGLCSVSSSTENIYIKFFSAE